MTKWEVGQPATAPARLEIRIHDSLTGQTIELALRLGTSSDPIEPMRLSAGTSGAGTDAALNRGTVAGRIAAPVSDLSVATESWLGHMRARNKKPSSIAAFRQLVHRAVKDNGWTSSSDITFASVTEWLAKGREEGRWKGTTYTRNLCVLKSLTRHLKSTGAIAEDPLVEAIPAEDDGDDGSRAATIEEARAVILQAWIRDQADRRCKGNRALYWLCLFSHACRVNEPSKWRRRHLVLDDPTPHLSWTREIMKNHKRRDIALAPELVPLLRAHLGAVDAERADRGLAPAGPDDLVFPVPPNRHTFVKDRDAAGVVSVDRRGRGFTAHSARKYFATVLTQTVPEKMVDFLMRHAGRVEHRYYDPPLAEQAEALVKLPLLWPRPGPDRPRVSGNVDNSDGDLTSGGRNAEYVTGTSAGMKSLSYSTTPPGSASLPKCQQGGRGPAGVIESVRTAARAALTGSGRLDSSSYEAGNRHFRPHNGFGPQSSALADLFDALARLLREGADHDGLEGSNVPPPDPDLPR